jgi:LmbE family N-acetylglucosaminyl deacetylase
VALTFAAHALEMRRALLLVPFLLLTVSAGGKARDADLLRPHLTIVPPAHADVVVFAPHPDDDVLGAGGVIQQARAIGESVVVVYMTSGDGYPNAAAAYAHRPADKLKRRDYLLLARARQQESIRAEATLGVPRDHLVYLGYPDAALDKVAAQLDAEPVTQPYTGRSATYGSWVRDFHSTLHRRPAPYTRAAAVADVEELVRRFQPSAVYTTMAADTHPDHAATFSIVNEALYRANYRGRFLTFLIHGASASWPWPRGADPTGRFLREAGAVPQGVSWPPPLRARLTPAQAARKLRAIEGERTQMALADEAEGLRSFAKGEELFWPVSPRW